MQSGNRSDEETDGHTEVPDQNLSFWQITASVLAAAFGVQKSKNRKRDFGSGKAKTFFIAGLIFTLFFILTLYGVVRLVLHTAGA